MIYTIAYYVKLYPLVNELNMKKHIIIIIALILASSCGTLERTRSVLTGFADFRPYTTAGIFISPDPYSGSEYTAIGEFAANIKPAIKMGANRIPEVERISPAELLDITVTEAKKRGANGIVDYHTTMNYKDGYLESYDISAFFILIHEVKVND